MDYDDLICKHCGKDWGRHYHQYCQFAKLTVFLPQGYEMTDVCSNCDQKFTSHIRHKYCYSDSDENNIFTVDHKLPDDLFEV